MKYNGTRLDLLPERRHQWQKEARCFYDLILSGDGDTYWKDILVG